MLQAIFADVRAFTKGAAQSDDITALVLSTARRRAPPITRAGRVQIDPGRSCRASKNGC